MTLFGMQHSEVADLMGAITPDSSTDEETRERVARAFWTAIAEPGDRIAGLAVASIGAVAALEVLAEGRTALDLWRLLRDSGANEIDSIELSEIDVRRAVERWQPRMLPSSMLVALRQAQRHGARLLVPSSPGWPARMSDLGAAGPVALWYRGTDAALASLATSISLVGARAATAYGEQVTIEASAGLVDRGYAIVSGAAYGIDGAAHRAALASHGRTIAFLAGGVDRFYPTGHDQLLARIAEVGAVISELPCGVAPTKWRFLSRNRLIAAASGATVVLEAGARSGSLNTAGHASTLGRPLGAVPGPVTSAASAGCHTLLREFDATCVTNADEMAELAPIDGLFDLLDAPAEVRRTGRLRDRPASQLRVLDAMSTRTPRNSAQIAVRSGLSIQDVRAVLGELHLEGAVSERETGWLA